MNTSGSQSAGTLTFLSRDRKRKADEDNSMNASKKPRFSGPIQRQNFAFRDSVIHYILQNEKMYQMLIKCCKYFYHKKSVLVVSDFTYDGNKWQTSLGNLTDLSILPCKLWITFDLTIDKSDNQNLVSSIVPEIFRCDIYYLNLCNQTMVFKDLVAIASCAKDIHLNNVTVKNEDGSIVQLEKLVGTLSEAKHIKM
uniref:Uncharacterized protein n=1 Tax=Panagrolaimus sp. ES5 TaxID=591445 RepID=A0AC34F6F8_9BILA